MAATISFDASIENVIPFPLNPMTEKDFGKPGISPMVGIPSGLIPKLPVQENSALLSSLGNIWLNLCCIRLALRSVSALR